ncbi:MAG: SPOR domain-containing protein [Tangfeifania sp.]
MMRTLFLFITGLFIIQLTHAQAEFPFELTADTVSTEADSVSISILEDLDVDQDPRVKKMLQWHIQDNQKMDGMEGFRIEIFSSSALNAKERALNKKVEFMSEYPDANVHVKFSAPVFKVRVGDFRTKKEALKTYKKIQKDYPGAFIVPDIINFPVLKTEKYERPD